MSLAAWQSALVLQVRDQRAETASWSTAPHGELSASEESSLCNYPGSRGLALTRSIQRCWRVTRLARSARLTLQSLPASLRDKLLTEFLDSHAGGALFYEAEVEEFLEFALSRIADATPAIGSICLFELAAHRAARTRQRMMMAPTLEASVYVARNPAAAIVWFPGAPERILCAAAKGEGLPVSKFNRALLVAPGLADLFRRPRKVEVELWERTAMPLSYDVLAASRRGAATAVRRLIADGALRCVG